ncbi:MAG: GAF domain-containing protein [Ferruginibacter sp.]
MTLSNETLRLENLYKYEILDTPPDGTFDEITSLASKIFNVPIALISLVDSDRIWFKSYHGIDVEQISRDPGLCSSAILSDSDDLYMVTEAKIDARTLSNPLVVGLLGLQFYAAVPLRTKEGYNLGTFCIIDKRPRSLNAEESLMLRQLARIVMGQLEVRLKSRILLKEFQERK